MENNLGSLDRFIRTLAAAVLGVGLAMNLVAGLLAAIFLLFGIFLLLTSCAGYCPVYKALSVDTRGAGDQHNNDNLAI